MTALTARKWFAPSNREAPKKEGKKEPFQNGVNKKIE